MISKRIKNILLWCVCLGFLLILFGCVKTPLTKLLNVDAPGYKPKTPASNDAELGKHMVGKQPSSNACFDGDLESEFFSSWSSRTLTYNHALHSDVKADFGDTIKMTVGGSKKTKIFVKLRNVQMQRLKNLFYNPKLGCELNIGESIEMNVLTRVLRADTISIKKESEGGIGLSVDTSKVSGKIGLDSDGASVWKGESLFFGHRIEKVRVTCTGIDRDLATGQGCDLNACTFVLDAIDKNLWSGTLSCRGLGNSSDSNHLQGKVGKWVSVMVGAGVSYSVLVDKRTGVGLGHVQILRYVTKTIK